ncbi:phosphoglycerate kinase [Candidatus Pacearchaeota archaeon]|nr:phosphoglycerate kinase [Candidatus Pacearchaeota archaeon]
MALKTLDSFHLSNARVLLRIDINSALRNGKPLDSPRFIEHSKTITELCDKKAKVVIIAHQGRQGEADCISLKHHSSILSKHIGKKVHFVNDLFGERASEYITHLPPGEVLLLENTRFQDDETSLGKKNRFKGFCSLFDFFINDAFSVSHREQGSIIIPPMYLPSAIGRSFENELKSADYFVKDKSGKKVYLLGGTKLDDYISFFKVLKNKDNKILTSGVLGNAFIAAQGIDLGYENIWMKKKGFHILYPNLRYLFSKHPGQIILPIDFAIGNKKRKEILLSDTPSEEKIWDIGHMTSALFKEHISYAKAVFMKGPVGYSEDPKFSYGTVDILKEISSQTIKKRCHSLLGGGHLTTTLTTYHIPNRFSSISLSGGALMAYLAGDRLPGLEVLKK